jgi:hypothetical protein
MLRTPVIVAVLLLTLARAAGADGIPTDAGRADLDAALGPSGTLPLEETLPYPPPLSRWLAEQPDEDLHFCAMPAGAALLGTFRIGAIILSRDEPNALPSAAVLRNADDAVLFDSGGLELDSHGGLDFTFAVAISSAADIQLRYFGIDEWSLSRVVTDPGGVRFVGFGETVPSLAERLDYTSKLYSFELNFRPRLTEVIPILIGFRTLQLHEGFEVRTIDVPALALGAHTNNFLYGAQIGIEPTILGGTGALQVGGLLKAGIYENLAKATAYDPPDGTTISARRNRASFVGEVGLNLAYRFGRFITLSGGYELLWVQGVALAPDQSTTVDLFNRRAALCTATTFYQGAVAAVEFTF